MSLWRQWSMDEDALVRKHYPEGGAYGVAHYLHGRSIGAIQRRAQRLNLPTFNKRGTYRACVKRTDDDWKRLAREIPEDTRTPGQRLMGEPIFERSALYRKQMEAHR